MSTAPRSFGLQISPPLRKPLPLEKQPDHHYSIFGNASHAVAEENLKRNELSDINYRRSNINFSSVSRTHFRSDLDFRSENLGGSNLYDNERLNNDLRRNNYVNSSLMFKSFGLPSRNLTVKSGLLSEGGLRLHQDSILRNNGLSTTKTVETRGLVLPGGLQRQYSENYNDNFVDDDGFKRPIISRVIRGRNSTLSSRLFHSENTERHCRDLSNINGFNVSHISQRNADMLSRSRFALNTRSNCLDNQSISQSIMSGASVKAQIMNLLESLHYSILSIGPNVTAEAVGLEFDKAKQRLDNISEMSFEPSIWNGDAASVTTQSSKNICPTVSQPTTSSILDGGLIHLKSSKQLLQSLVLEKEGDNKMKTQNSSIFKRGKAAVIRSSRKKDSDQEEDSDLVFKKPRGRPKGRKKSLEAKQKSSGRTESSSSEKARKVINLKQWYPIAVGSDLAFCGVDEQGATVKTEAVKKRLNNRRVELIGGLACQLIGSPSTMVSILPKKIMSLLKNGLTERWRVLQKELLNCQTADTKDTKKRKSKSPKVISSPKKKSGKAVIVKVGRRKAQEHEVITTLVEEGGEISQTRSGRTIKPPRMFWLAGATEIDEVMPSTPQSIPKKAAGRMESPNRTLSRGIEETPVKKTKKPKGKSPSPRMRATRDASRGRKKKVEDDRKPSEAKGTKGKGREEVKIDSSKGQNKSRQSSNKRKREVAGEADAVQAKKSKVENKHEEVIEHSSKAKVKKASQPKKQSPKPKRPKTKPSVVSKKKEPVKKKPIRTASESNKETKQIGEVNETTEDFELKLDDIEIPEIGNFSGNTQLNRSQLRLVSMETPPLKYFSNNLRLLRSATPARSPDWCTSQRTESEVKQFQRRREEAFKKRIKVDVQRTVITEKTKNVQNKDVKRVVEWVAEKTVSSPQWNSRVLQYIIPSRKRMEQQADEEDEDEIGTEFL